MDAYVGVTLGTHGTSPPGQALSLSVSVRSFWNSCSFRMSINLLPLHLSCLRWPVNAYKTPIKEYALSFFSFFRFHSSLLCCFILSIVSAFVSSALLSRTQPSSLYVYRYLSLSLSSTFVFPSSSLLSISVRFHLSVSAVSSLWLPLSVSVFLTPFFSLHASVSLPLPTAVPPSLPTHVPPSSRSGFIYSRVNRSSPVGRPVVAHRRS